MGISHEFLKQNPELFITKKVLLFSPILLILMFIWPAKWYCYVCGLLLGILGSLIKLYVMGHFYTLLLTKTKREKRDVRFTILKMVLVQLFSLVIMLTASFLDFTTIIGAFLGLLAVPSVVSINSITEYFGITQNKFGCR